MRELLTCLLIALASFQLAAATSSASDNKVVRMKRNYEEPNDLQFHHADDSAGLVRIKRHRRSAEEPTLSRVKRDEDELQRYKRTKRDTHDELKRFKREKRDTGDELKRFKREKRDTGDELKRFKREKRDTGDELKRFKREKRDTGDELKRFKREKRDSGDEELHRFKRQKRDLEAELQRFKRQKRDAEDELEKRRSTDPEALMEESPRSKRTRRDVESSPSLSAKDKKDIKKDTKKEAKKEAKAKKRVAAISEHRRTPKVLKREKKTNLNHHWQKHEKRGGNGKHHIMPRLKKNAPRGHKRSDLLASHALRNVHLVSKRNKLGNKLAAKHRVKRTQKKAHPYNKLEADVAKLGRLRRDIALNLHKANQKSNQKNAIKRRVKRMHQKNNKKSSLKKH